MSTKTKTKIKKLTAPKGFRFLREGETIKLNDKWLNLLNEWNDELPTDPNPKVGVKWHQNVLVPYARAIKHPAPKPAAKGRKAVKAVRMWTQREDMDDINLTPVCMSRTSSINGDIPYAVLDISDEAALIEQVANAFGGNASNRDYAIIALESLGLIAKRRK